MSYNSNASVGFHKAYYANIVRHRRRSECHQTPVSGQFYGNELQISKAVARICPNTGL